MPDRSSNTYLLHTSVFSESLCNPIMASSNEDNDRQRAHDDASNPFIAFRRFADEQISNLMHNVFGISSSSSPDRRMQDYQIWLREARESRDRLNRETEEADRIMDLYTRAHKEGQDPAQEEIQKAIQGDIETMRCPFRPAEEDMPPRNHWKHPGESIFAHSSAQAPFSTPVRREAREPFRDPFVGLELASLPIAYLLHSPYSPINLEEQQALQDRGIDWCEAFEDLLAAQKGQEMPSDSSHRPSGSSTESVRGMMGMLTGESYESVKERQEALRAKIAEEIKEMPNLRFLMSDPSDTRQPESDAAEDEHEGNAERDDEEEEEFTELDLYDRFLGREQQSAAQATARSFAHLQHDSSPTETDGKKPNILSTLTTTERTTLQDGTVHTKTVLKKRFSDGREVKTETVHTQNALPQKHSPQISQSKKEDGHGQEKKSSGWFWS